MTKLVLALGFSGGLHAALLTSLDLLPVQWREPPRFHLTVQMEQHSAPEAPAAPKKLRSASQGAAGSTRPPERYLTSREVDAPAQPREVVPLVYPENPLIWKLRGVVRLRLLISELGAVDGAEVILAEPPGEFEEAALDAARRMRYEPAVKNGRPVKSQKLIEVTFDPHEAPSKP